MKRRDVLRVVTVLLSFVTMSGCWLQPGAGPQHRFWNPFEDRLTAENVATLEERWFVDFPETGPTLYLGDGIGSPIVWGGRVIVRPDDLATGVHLKGYDVATGDLAWDVPLDSSGSASEFWSAPAIVDGEILMSWPGSASVGSPPCQEWEVRVDPGTGEVVERTDQFPVRRAGATVFGDRIVQLTWQYPTEGCNSIDEIYFGVRDAGTGEVLWKLEGDLNQSPPMVTDGWIVMNQPHYVAAYSADGCGAATCLPDWRVHHGTTAGPLLGADGMVFFSSSGQTLAISTATQQIAWTTDTSGRLAYADGTLYVVGGGVVSAYDAGGCGTSTCSPLWTAALPDEGVYRESSVAVAGGVLYVGLSDHVADPKVGRVVALDADGCGASTCDAVLWTSPVQPGTINSIVVSDGTLIAQIENSSVYPSRLVAFAPVAADP